jgi:manganese/zinc/iron transport system permease protein
MSEPDLLWRALAVLSLQAGYNSAVVLVGTALLGIAAGVVGAFTFLRRRALISDALAHATLPGIAGAFILGAVLGLETRSLPLLLTGAALSGALGVLLVQWIARYTRLPEDAAIGAVLSVFFGLGVVLLSYIQTMPTGGQAGLGHFILGQTAAMSRAEAIAMGVLAFIAIAAVAVFFKEFRLVCFDAGFAQAQGWPVFRIDLAIAALTILVTVIGLQTVGLVLIIALLIVPPVAARFWTDRLSRMVVIAGAIGGLSGYFGATLSAVLPDIPAGAIIVVTAGVFFLFSLSFAPRRGLIAAALLRSRQRLRLA